VSWVPRQGNIPDFACLTIYYIARSPELFVCLTIYENAETLSLAASLRSALRIRCWCCITTLCLCYLRWCRQHHILMLFQDNGTRLRRACRLRQISQDSMHTSRRLPGPRTRGGSGVNPLSSYPFKADPLGNNSSRCLWAGIISVSSG